MHYVITATVAVLILHVASSRKLQDAEREESSGETERIVGGQAAAPGQFPWATALFYNNDFICTSSIISPNTVMTAAHCVQFNGVNQPAESFHAIANVMKSAPEVRIDFSEVVVHPEYDDSSIDNDIALLTTTEPIPFSEDVQPICIAGPNIGSLEKQPAIAMGWGDTSRLRGVQRIPDELQYVDQIVVPEYKCQRSNFGVTGNKICAQGQGLFPFRFNGVCNGDSGGPLVFMNGTNPPVEIGIASYLNALYGCGSPKPEVHTRVSSYYDWIKTNAVDGENICSS